MHASVPAHLCARTPACINWHACTLTDVPPTPAVNHVHRLHSHELHLLASLWACMQVCSHLCGVYAGGQAGRRMHGCNLQEGWTYVVCRHCGGRGRPCRRDLRDGGRKGVDSATSNRTAWRLSSLGVHRCVYWHASRQHVDINAPMRIDRRPSRSSRLLTSGRTSMKSVSQDSCWM